MLLFHCLLPVIATDRAHRTPYTYAVLLLPARNPTNSPICILIANRRVPLCDPHLHFARFARDIYAISPQKPIHARFCRRTAVRRPVPTLSAPSIPASGAGERISLCSRFMWNIRLVIRQNLNVYRNFCLFMHIYTLRYCMFFSYAFAFAVPAILSPLPLRGWRSRLGAALLHPVPHPAESHACRLIDSRLHSLSAIESLVPHFLDLFSSHTCDRRDVRSFCLYFSLTPDFCL